MRLIINEKLAAKTLRCINDKYLAVVNACFLENSGYDGLCETDFYEELDVVAETGLVQGLKIEKKVHDWLIEQKNMIKNGSEAYFERVKT